MVIDWTINGGQIFEIGSILVGGLAVVITLRSDVRGMKTEITAIQTEVKKIGDVLITQADQNRRILHLEEDFRELRHGHGFIQGPRGVDREFP